MAAKIVSKIADQEKKEENSALKQNNFCEFGIWMKINSYLFSYLYVHYSC